MEALAAKDKNLVELDAEDRRPHEAVRGAVRAGRRADEEAAVARNAARAARARWTSSPRRRPWQMDSLRQSRAGPRRAAQGDPGLLQVARRSRQAARQAGRRSRGARGVRRADDRACGARAGARSQDGRDPRQDEAGRRGHAEGDAARTRSVAELDAQISRVTRPRAVRREARRPAERAERPQRRRRPQARGTARAPHRARDAEDARATASPRRWSTRSTSSMRVRALQTRLVPLVAELDDAARRDRRRPTSASTDVKFDEAAIVEQEKRLRGAGGREHGGGDRSRRAHAADAGARPRSSAARPRSRTSCSPSSIASRAGSATPSARSRRPRIS